MKADVHEKELIQPVYCQKSEKKSFSGFLLSFFTTPLLLVPALFFSVLLLNACAGKNTDAGLNTCIVSISCATILDNMDLIDPEKKELVPEDGWILKPVEVPFEPGESVFDVLQRVVKENHIHMEYSMTPIYNSAYIEGIANLYEFDAGSLSGWEYSVNDYFPNYGCSAWELKDGDVIKWMYTCDLGKDVGGGLIDEE